MKKPAIKKPAIKKPAWILASILAVLSLVAVACGSDREDDSAPTTTAAPAAVEDGSETSSDSADDHEETSEPSGPTFGDLEWPCGPGDASGETHQGVTDETITIGVGDDRGFPTSPGLNQHQTNAVINFINKCNELGGINGRQIEFVEYDAAIIRAPQIIVEACEEVFMLVGSGFSLDNLAEPARVECGLGAVPAWTVSADFAHGPFQVNAVPNPSDQQAMSLAVQVSAVADERGYDITKSGAMFGDFAATQETWYKVEVSWPDVGYEFVQDLEYSINGEADWSPFITQLQNAGVEHVNFVGSCPFFYQAVREAAALQEFDAIWTVEANFYDSNCADQNTEGAMDNTFVRMVFIPFEEADSNQATQDFIDVLAEAGNDQVTLLGMQAVSNFLLWATAAKECGSGLTRDCVLNEIAEISEWTGHGLHVPTIPSDNNIPSCGLMMELVGQGYVRVAPSEPGTFDCNEDWRKTVSVPAVEAALLDENRISTKHTGEGS